jgi:hypothetical protein
MKWNRKLRLSRALLIVTLLTLVALALVLTKPAAVKAQTGCSVATLSGGYGYAWHGFFLSHPGAPVAGWVPFASSGIRTYDGNGSLSGSQTSNLAGSVFPEAYTGTYTVNSDCTGSATMNFPRGEIVTENFTIVDGAKEIERIATVQRGGVVSGSLKKQ